jgi:hypothetical protein
MTSLVSILGKSLSQFLMPSIWANQYRSISGIGFTEPKLNLFTNTAERAAWDLRHEYDAPLNATPDALARQIATWSLFGDLASERIGYMAQYVSTAFVARDMLRITEAYGYSKLSYWGFSYGSVVSNLNHLLGCMVCK